MAADPIVRISHLSKRFPVRRGWVDTLLHPRRISYADVLGDVSLEIPAGELFGLLGPNGAGKTTLFKILSTLILPDQGSVRIAGHDLIRDAASVRDVLTPVIVDERSLNWRISARDNLRLYAALHGLRGSHAKQRVDEVLHVVGLAEAGTKMVAQFSSGMRQRLLIARSLMHRPRILLLDEPTRSLDPISARQFRTFLREEVVGVQGCTVLLATHNPEEALELCDRVGILHRGRVVATGSPQALADSMAGDGYQVWTRTPDHPMFARMLADGRITAVTHTGEIADWSIMELRLNGGRDAVPDILAALVAGGVQVARFEQAPVALADLIEQAIRTGGPEADNA